MNGMKAKAARIRHARRFDAKGLPRDAKDWTEDDWRDLHNAIEKVKSNVKRRHAAEAVQAKASSKGPVSDPDC